jgi:hypothetical protein
MQKDLFPKFPNSYISPDIKSIWNFIVKGNMFIYLFICGMFWKTENLQGKPKCLDKESQCHFIHCKSHLNRPGLKDKLPH